MFFFFQKFNIHPSDDSVTLPLGIFQEKWTCPYKDSHKNIHDSFIWYSSQLDNWKQLIPYTREYYSEIKRKTLDYM